MSDISWIECHLHKGENMFLCEVGKDYIRDNFNLTGLPNQVPYFRQALKKILNWDHIFKSEENPRIEGDVIEKAAELLYGLIHARYILTCCGMQQMIKKYEMHSFGICPRVYCEGQHLLPVGLTDTPGEKTVKVYCPKCVDVYAPKGNLNRGLDGAYFGTGFPHMLLMMFPGYRPKKPKNHFTPKLHGFQIHKMELDQLQAPGAGAEAGPQ